MNAGRPRERERNSLGPWLGASTLAHAGLLALGVGLVAYGSAPREEVMRVALVTVESRHEAPGPVRETPVPKAMRETQAPQGRRFQAPAPLPGRPGLEGVGWLGGDGRPAGAPEPAPRPPHATPTESAESLASPSPADPRNAEGGMQGLTPQSEATAEQAAREGPAAGPPPPADLQRHAATHLLAGRLPSADPLEGPIPKGAGTVPGGSGRLQPTASSGQARGEGVPARGGGAGQGLGQGEGRGLGATSGHGSGMAGRGPGADGTGVGPGAAGASRPPNVTDLLAQIRRRIEAVKRYPEDARREGIQGSVYVRFRVREDGQVDAVEVAQSSGSRLLDEDSLDTIRRAAPFPPVLGWVRVPIAYTLGEGEP